MRMLILIFAPSINSFAKNCKCNYSFRNFKYSSYFMRVKLTTLLSEKKVSSKYTVYRDFNIFFFHSKRIYFQFFLYGTELINFIRDRKLTNPLRAILHFINFTLSLSRTISFLRDVINVCLNVIIFFFTFADVRRHRAQRDKRAQLDL